MAIKISNPIINEEAGSANFIIEWDIKDTYKSFSYEVLAGTATEKADYAPVTGIVSLEGKTSPLVVSVPVVNDALAEGQETFSLVITKIDGTQTGGILGTATILASDPLITAGDATVNESDEKVTFSVSLATPVTTPVTVYYETMDGTAVAGKDYEAKAKQVLTFQPGETVKNVEVKVTNDTLPEENEFFQLVLSDPEGGTLTTPSSTATATILASDVADVMVSIDNVVVNETDDFATFTVSLDTPTSRPVSFHFATVDETAKSGSDYVQKTGDASIPAGELSTTIKVPIIADIVPEEPERFSLKITNINAGGISELAATATIRENAQTGAGIAINDTFTTAVNKSTDINLLVNDIDPNYGTTGGLYVVFVNTKEVGEISSSGDNKGKLNSVGVTGASTSAGGSITIDSYGKGLYTPKPGYSGPDSFTYTIRDYPFNGFYHLSTATVNITVNDKPIAVNDAATTNERKPVTFDVLKNDVDTDSLTVVQVGVPSNGLAVNNGGGLITYTPKAGFVGTDTFSYTITDGIDSGQGLITVTVISDDTTAGVGIANNDTFTTAVNKSTDINLLVNDIDPNYGTTGGLYVVFVNTKKVGEISSSGDDKGKLTSVGVTGESTSAGGSITIDSYGKGLYTPKPGYSGPDSFTYTIRDYPFNGFYHLSTATANITVIANDKPIAVNDVLTTTERKPVTFDVLKNDIDTDSLTVVQVGFPFNGIAVNNGGGLITYTPRAGFVGTDTFSYTITDGIDSGQGLITVTVTSGDTTGGSGVPLARTDEATTTQNNPVDINVLDNDADPDNDALFLINVTKPEHGTVLEGIGGLVTYIPDHGFSGQDHFNYVIKDDTGHKSSGLVNVTVETVTPFLSINDVTVKEGDDAVWTVALSEPAAGPITVNWTVSGVAGPEGKNAANASGTLTFESGERLKTITVKTADNTVVDPTAAVAVRLIGPVGVLLADSEGIATVLDNDSPPGLNSSILSIQGEVLDESDKNALFTLTLNKPSSSPITLNYTTQDGAAIAGQDYTATNGALTFAPGEMVKTVSVPVTNDILLEGDEAFQLTLSNTKGATVPVPYSSAVIAANDVKLSTIYIEDTASNEHQGYVDFYIRLDVPSINPVAVNYTTVDDFAYAGSDYIAQTGTVRFSPGETFKTVRVALIDSPPPYEFNENFQLVLSNPNGANLGRSTGNAVITDDEPFIPAEQFVATVSIEDTVAAENEGYASFVVKLNFPLGEFSKPSQTVTVNYATVSGVAIGGSDFVAQTGTLKFDPGETFKIIRVPLTNDTVTETSTETFSLVLGQPDGEGIGLDRSIGYATIVDDDPAQLTSPQVSVEDSAAAEGQGYVDFHVRLDKPSANTIAVNYNTADGTAVSGKTGDYLAQTGTINFEPGETLKTIRVALVDDTVVENTEKFQVILSASNNATVAHSQASGTIVDNDTAASGIPTLSIDSIRVDEGAGEATFTVSLDKPSTNLVTVNYGTVDGLAKAGLDYTSVNGTLSFAPGETAKTIRVSIINDSLTESDEAFNVVLANPSDATLPSTGNSGTATILKSDGINDTTVIAINDPVVAESDGLVQFKITLNAAQTEPVSFDYATVGGTAEEKADYGITTGNYTIQPGETQATIYVPIIEDFVAENPESFILKLTNIRIAGNAINDLSGTATIKANDQAGIVAVDDSATTTQGQPVRIPLFANDINPAKDALTVTAINGSSIDRPLPGKDASVEIGAGGGIVLIDTNGNAIYTPSIDFIGTARFTYTLTDGQGHTSTAFVNVKVNSAAPIPGDDKATTKKDQSVTIPVLANDTDPQGDVLSISDIVYSKQPYGTANITDHGTTITYTPLPGFFGLDMFGYIVTDGQHKSGGMVTVTVTNTGSGAPTAANDVAATTKNQPVAIKVLANDTDPQNDILSLKSVNEGKNGTAIINGDGVITYTPNANFVGSDSFTYVVTDSLYNSTGVVTVTVNNAESGAPIAVNDMATTSKNQPITIKALANDTDPQNDILLLKSVSDGGNGKAVINGDGIITYTPKVDFVGSDSFTYVVTDSLYDSTGVITVTVTNTGSGAPNAITDTATTSQSKTVSIQVLANDKDPENDQLSLVSVATPPNGTAITDINGSVIYTPKKDFLGLDSFTYTVTDGQGHSSVGLINVTVGSGSPSAQNDSAVTDKNTPITFSVLANDSDPQGDALSIKSISAPQNGGSVVQNGAGVVTYSPKKDYNGNDSFTYTVTDGSYESTGLVTITVKNTVAGTPVAVNDTAITSQDKTVLINVLKNDVDPQGDTLSLVDVSFSEKVTPKGTVFMDGKGGVVYAPNPGATGEDTFEYTITDGAYSDVGTVTVNIESGTPTASSDSAITKQGTPVSIPVLLNDTDPQQGDVLRVKSLNLTSLSEKVGTATIGKDGTTVVYTPARDYFTTDATGSSSDDRAKFNYTISDDLGHTSSATVFVTVNKSSPTAQEDTASTQSNKPVTIEVLRNDSDPDQDALSVLKIDENYPPKHGTAEVIEEGKKINYIPGKNYSGEDSFKYVLKDSQEYTATGLVTVTINNYPPKPENDTVNMKVADKFVKIEVLENDFDPDGDTLSVVKIDENYLPKNGGYSISEDKQTITYTPKQNYVGGDSFKYVVTDNQGHTATALVNVTIENTRPENGTDIPDQTATPNQFFTFVVPSNSFIETDAGDYLSYRAALVKDGEVGGNLPSWLLFDPGNRTFSGTPPASEVGTTYAIRVTANDKHFAEVYDDFDLKINALSQNNTPTTTTGNDANTTVGNNAKSAGSVDALPPIPILYNAFPGTDDHSVNIRAGNTYLFSATDFPFTDEDQGDSLHSVSIESLPVEGQLRLNNQGVVSGQVITRSEIDTGKLSYFAPKMVEGSWTQHFSFTVGDGEAFSEDEGEMTITISPPATARLGTPTTDVMQGTAKSDLLIAKGGGDTLNGKDGADRLYGEGDRDLLKAGNGNDFLSGGEGEDRLFGGEGRDILVGGEDNDIVNGGAGKDTYKYLASTLGSADLQAGDYDVLYVTPGDQIVFNAVLWTQLKASNGPLSTLSGEMVGPSLKNGATIAFDGDALEIDIDGNGTFSDDHDFLIELVGQVTTVEVDQSGAFLVIY